MRQTYYILATMVLSFIIVTSILIILRGSSVFDGEPKYQPKNIKDKNWKICTENFSLDVPEGWFAYFKYQDTVYLSRSKSADTILIAVYKVESSNNRSKIVKQLRKEAIATSKDGRWQSTRLEVGGRIYDGIQFIGYPQGVNRERCNFFVVRQAEIVLDKHIVVITCFLPDGKETQDMKRILDSFYLKEGDGDA